MTPARRPHFCVRLAKQGRWVRFCHDNAGTSSKCSRVCSSQARSQKGRRQEVAACTATATAAPVLTGATCVERLCCALLYCCSVLRSRGAFVIRDWCAWSHLPDAVSGALSVSWHLFKMCCSAVAQFLRGNLMSCYVLMCCSAVLCCVLRCSVVLTLSGSGGWLPPRRRSTRSRSWGIPPADAADGADGAAAVYEQLSNEGRQQ